MKYFFLSFLSKEPTHGYDLLLTYKAHFSSILPPLNAGQVYTTLARMERDGLVKKFTVQQDGKPDKQVYQCTEKGRKDLVEWLSSPVSGPHIKDDFYMKLMSARESNLVEPQKLINLQRNDYLQNLHSLNNLILQANIANDPSRLLLVQGAILHLKADLEWLVLCEKEYVQD